MRRWRFDLLKERKYTEQDPASCNEKRLVTVASVGLAGAVGPPSGRGIVADSAPTIKVWWAPFCSVFLAASLAIRVALVALDRRRINRHSSRTLRGATQAEIQEDKWNT